MQWTCAILWPVVCPTLKYFSSLFHKRHDFRGGGERVTDYKLSVLIFSISFVWNISRPEKNWTRYEQKPIFIFTYSNNHACQILVKLEFSRQIFEKFSIKYYENPSGGAELFHTDWRTNRQTDVHKEDKLLYSVLLTRLITNKRKRYSMKGWSMISRVRQGRI